VAQLNFQVPDDLLERLDAQKPEYLDRKGFLCLLIDQALDRPVTLGVQSVAGTPSSSNSSISKKKESIITLSICDELKKHEELIREFWRLKKGSKGSTAWKLLNTELKNLKAKYGDAVVEEQLQLAINGKWAGIRLSNYEAFKAPKGNAPAQPEMKHPAHRDFTAERLERERRLAEGDQSIPSATGGRGVLDLL
jgi:hypothetical protein